MLPPRYDSKQFAALRRLPAGHNGNHAERLLAVIVVIVAREVNTRRLTDALHKPHEQRQRGGHDLESMTGRYVRRLSLRISLSSCFS